MAATRENAPLIVALVNSLTLESELMSGTHLTSPYTTDEHLSLCAVAQMMSRHDRDRFISALSCRHGFECVVQHDGHRLSISLCTTGAFGGAWSHLLVLGVSQSSILPA